MVQCPARSQGVNGRCTELGTRKGWIVDGISTLMRAGVNVVSQGWQDAQDPSSRSRSQHSKALSEDATAKISKAFYEYDTLESQKLLNEGFHLQAWDRFQFV